MQAQLTLHLEQMGLIKSIMVEYLYLPPYSPRHALRGKRDSAPGRKPCLNLVEYVIHLVRLRFLHHLPIGTTLVQIEQQLLQFLDSNQFLSAQQVEKTLNYIFSLPT